MEATINSIFVRDPVEPVELGLTKEDAPTLDGYRFHLNRNISTEITMSKDPQDGGYFTLLIGVFIDGVEAAYVTDWIRNDDENRTREYAFGVPKSPVKLMKETPKIHSVQIKVGIRKRVFTIPLSNNTPRLYETESEVYYYKIGKLPE